MGGLGFRARFIAEKADDAEDCVRQHRQIADESLEPAGVENIDLVRRYIRAGPCTDVLRLVLQCFEIAAGEQNPGALLGEPQGARATYIRSAPTTRSDSPLSMRLTTP
jgi:hypothetical protein